MSPRARSTPGPFSRALLRLYPRAWRRRYAQEMHALLADDPPGVRGLISLALGAADAHLHPRPAWNATSAPLVRVRLSVGAMFGCWIAMSVLGMAFQKETEEAGFSVAAAHHPLLEIARAAILAGAVVGAITIALAGVPLVWVALRQAVIERDRTLALLLLTPLLALSGFAATSWLLFTLAPSRGGGFPAEFVLTILLPWQLAALACATVLALTPRAVLARVTPSPAALRRAARATPALAAATVAVSSGIAVYALVLARDAPALADLASGPVGASTGAMLAGEGLAALILCVPALICAARARAAAR